MEDSTGNRLPIVTTGDLDGRVFSLSPKGDWLLFTRSEGKSSGVEEAEVASTEDEATVDDPTVEGTTVEGAAAEGVPGEEVPDINSLWAVNLAVEGSKPVDLDVRNVIHFADWVPDQGLTISFSTVEPRITAPGWQANNELQILSFTSSGNILNQETIIEANAGGVYGWWGTDFAWSPDGRLLAYARPDGVGLVDLDTNTLVPVVDILPFQTGADWAWVPGISWAASSNVLYMVTHASLTGFEPAEASPVFHLSGLPITIISTPPETPDTIISFGPSMDIVNEVGMFAYPVSSPEREGGYWVAYLQSREPRLSDSKRYRLGIMDRDGSNRSLIFPPEDRQGMEPQQVDWSPAELANEHLWLAVNYQGNLSLVDSQTGDEQPVTGDGLVTIFDWK